MATIKDLLRIAFVSGENNGMHAIRNFRDGIEEPVKSFDEYIKEVPFNLIDLEMNVKVKEEVK